VITENILKVKERIGLICFGLNKDPLSVKIVAVSKGRTVEEIKKVVQSGIYDIGENRIQEAVEKFDAIRSTLYAKQIKWHLVGHLQTNKVKEAVRVFTLIHSVDSLRLACEINRAAAKLNKIQDILIQVNTSQEKSKFGLRPTEVNECVQKTAQLKNLNIRGLMTIAPLVDNSEKARTYFRILKEIFDELNNLQVTARQLEVLSMGMTEDFSVAIEEGSNTIRLGRAIFEG
jgi:hypothetical protein